LIRPPVKIGITGTHSTGKTSFLDALEPELARSGLRVCGRAVRIDIGSIE
jgi:putative protein kinase ArgK-like GTPase of G3E family